MNWDGKRVLIIGAARQGTALARYMARAGAEVLINDQAPLENLIAAREALAGLPVRWQVGGHPMEVLEGIDLVCVSGGVPLDLPLVVEARARSIPLSNDSQLFMEAVPCRVVGITGSAGKSTTTALVGHIAQHAVRVANGIAHSQNGGHLPGRVWVGGNIGAPLIASLREIGAEDLVVMELSSFQLELMSISPQIAAVLNITPNHLDRHKTMIAYRKAKERIVRFQHSEDTSVLGTDDPGAWSLSAFTPGRLITFGKEAPPEGQAGAYLNNDRIWYRDGSGQIEVIEVDRIPLLGDHNLQNVLAATAISFAAELPVEAVVSGVSSFQGLSHRLEFVREWHGADWYNDSIATAPERTMAAIHCFDKPLILLAGGRDKDLPWGSLASLVRARVDHLVVFGEASELITRAIGDLTNGDRPFTLDRSPNLEQAVQIAASRAEPGDVVLLSPGCTSFDEFRDFEERGEYYKQWVMGLS